MSITYKLVLSKLDQIVYLLKQVLERLPGAALTPVASPEREVALLRELEKERLTSAARASELSGLEGRLRMLDESFQDRLAAEARLKRMELETSNAEWRMAEEKRIRETAIKSSRSTIRGQATEQLVPLTGLFPYSASDSHFFGSPIDYLIFDGAGEVLDGNAKDIVNIVMLDVKCGKSARLTKLQQAIKRAISEGRVTWVTLDVPDSSIPICGKSTSV